MDINEITAAMELVSEKQGRFTVPEVAKIISPAICSNKTEYMKILRVAKKLAARGDLCQTPTTPGSPLIFTISPGGIESKGLDHIFPGCGSSLWKKTFPKRNRPRQADRGLFSTPAAIHLAGATPAMDQAPAPSMSAIHQALVAEFATSPDGVALKDICRRFPGSRQEDVRLRLKVMESEGEVESTKAGTACYYTPTLADRPIPLPTANRKERKDIKRVRLFPCEVCDAAIPAAASASLYTIPCNSCQSVYLIEGGEAYRLAPGIKIKTWIPDPG